MTFKDKIRSKYKIVAKVITFPKKKRQDPREFDFKYSSKELAEDSPLSHNQVNELEKEIDRVDGLLDESHEQHDQDVIQNLGAYLNRIVDRLERSMAKLPPDDKKEQDLAKEYNKIRKRYKDSPEILKHIGKLHNEPYVGPSTTKWGSHKQEVDFPIPTTVKDLSGVLGKDVLIGGPDPFSWADSKYKVSFQLLEKNHDNPLVIHTRSDLIGHSDYIELLNPSKHKVFIHVCSTDEEFNRQIESGQPSALRRISAAKHLHDKGIQVSIAHDVFEINSLSPEVVHFNGLNEIKLRKEASGVKVVKFPFKISDSAAKIINNAMKSVSRKAG